MVCDPIWVSTPAALSFARILFSMPILYYEWIKNNYRVIAAFAGGIEKHKNYIEPIFIHLFSPLNNS